MSVPQSQLFNAGTPASLAPQATVTQGGDPSLVQDLTSVAQLGGSIYGLVNSAGLNSAAQTAIQQSNPFGQYRPQYGQQLLQLMQDPSSISSQPGYQFLLNQGITAAQRGAAAPGGAGLGSGGEAAELTTFGEGLADQYYQQQIQTLSGLAGANISPANPAQALQAAGGAASGLGSSIAGLTSGVGGTAALLAKLFPGGTNPNLISSSYDPNTSVFTGQPGQTSVDWTGSTSPNMPSSFTDPSVTGGFSGAPGDTSVDSPGFDISDLFANPSGAGGQAANPILQPIGEIADTPTDINLPSGGTGFNLGSAGTAFGAYSGIASGTPTGYAGAALDIGKLTNTVSGGSAAASSALGAAGGVLGLYTGLKEGGVGGDYSAAMSGAQVANAAAAAAGAETAGTAAAVGSALGAVAIPLSVAAYGYSTPAVELTGKYNQNFINALQDSAKGSAEQLSSLNEVAIMALQGELPGGANTGPGGVSGASPDLATIANSILESEYGSNLSQLEYDISGAPLAAAYAAGDYVPPVGNTGNHKMEQY